MKYLQRYIKSLSENVVEKKCIETSSSTYYIVDDGFKIRLSDHFAPISVASALHLEIVQIFDSEDFIILYKNFKSPMKKNRKEVKDFLKFAYDVYRMGQMAHEQSKEKTIKNASDEEKKELQDKIFNKLNKEWKSYTSQIDEIFSKYPSFIKIKNWERFGAILGALSVGSVDKEVKNVFKSYLNSKKLNNRKILEVIYNIYNIEGGMAVTKDIVKAYCNYAMTNVNKE